MTSKVYGYLAIGTLKDYEQYKGMSLKYEGKPVYVLLKVDELPNEVLPGVSGIVASIIEDKELVKKHQTAGTNVYSLHTLPGAPEAGEMGETVVWMVPKGVHEGKLLNLPQGVRVVAKHTLPAFLGLHVGYGIGQKTNKRTAVHHPNTYGGIHSVLLRNTNFTTAPLTPSQVGSSTHGVSSPKKRSAGATGGVTSRPGNKGHTGASGTGTGKAKKSSAFTTVFGKNGKVAF